MDRHMDGQTKQVAYSLNRGKRDKKKKNETRERMRKKERKRKKDRWNIKRERESDRQTDSLTGRKHEKE